MIPVKLTIILAQGGARGDFVAGWLGTLDNYIDTQWRIDINTGKSAGLMNCFKSLNQFNCNSDTLSQIISNRRYIMDPESPWSFAFSWHSLSILNKITPNDLPAVKVLRVTTEGVDPLHLVWEFTAKTFLSTERYESSVNEGIFCNVDRLCPGESDQQKVRYVKECANRLYNSIIKNTYRATPNAIDISYQQLFRPGGSRYLCNCLQTSASERHHALWDSSLQLAESKLEYVSMGITWTKSNFLY